MALVFPARPHDLLWLKHLPHWPDAPEWVAIALARTPVVVVRRAGAPQGLVSVGVRGARRCDRYGAQVSLAEIECGVSPEMLHAGTPSLHESRASLPAFTLLRGLAPFLRHSRLVWGPTGSVGFELATGEPVVQAGSDLDLLIRVPEWIGRDTGRSLLGTLSTLAAEAGVRVDAQLETPGGAVSLAEYAGSTQRVLLRGSGEPVMVEDPWAWGAQPGPGFGFGPHALRDLPSDREVRVQPIPASLLS